MKSSTRLYLRSKSGAHDENNWTFDNTKEITAGFLPACSVYLTDPLAGPSRILFKRQGSELRLRLSPDVKGDLSIDGKSVSIESLREAGFLKSDRRGPYVAIGPKTSGTVSLGATQIRFWLTPAPKEPEFPLHPLHVRWFRLMAQSYTPAVIISLILHLVLGLTIKTIPAPPPQTWDNMDRSVARLLIPKDMLPTKPEEPKAEVDRYTAPKEKEEQAPLKVPPAAGFLAAVTRTKPGEKASPFEKLFSTDSIGKDLTQALKTESLDTVIAKQMKGLGTVDVEVAPKAVDIGVPKGGGAPSTQLQRQASAPSLSRMSVDTPEVEGTMNREALTDIVNRNAGQLRDCYERGLSRKPNLSGKVVVGLIVSDDGHPANVGIEESSLSDPAVERCIVGKISLWVFPKPKGGSTPVKFPFIFTASSRG